MSENQLNREQLMRLAIKTAKSGNDDGAKVMFRQVLADDPSNEKAMLWMAKLTENKVERKRWITRVLSVNPDNEVALNALEKMESTESAAQNRDAILIGSLSGAVAMILTLAGTALWAFWPL